MIKIWYFLIIFCTLDSLVAIRYGITTCFCWTDSQRLCVKTSFDITLHQSYLEWLELYKTAKPLLYTAYRIKRQTGIWNDTDLAFVRSSSSSQLVLWRTWLSCWQSCISDGWKPYLEQSATRRHLSSNADCFSELPQNFSFSDHFLPNCFWRLVSGTDEIASFIKCICTGWFLYVFCTACSLFNFHHWLLFNFSPSRTIH